MTHGFNYGTGVFEGIRGYWNEEKKQIYILKLREHYERLHKSANLALKAEIKFSLDELEKITVELARKNEYKQDIYFRPIYYKSQEKVGLGLIGIEDDFCMYLAPFGNYLDVAKGIKVCISSWARIPASSIPQGAKITGTYINSSLAKAEALEKGFDEAILLSTDNYVAEGSGENLFMVNNGELITPPLTETILPGITRTAIIEIAARELGLKTIERRVARDELYLADELFFCGTGAQVSAIVGVDDKVIKNGEIGKFTKLIQDIYFKIVRGNDSRYESWLTPVY